MLMSKDNTMRKLLKSAKECEVDLVGLRELYYKGVNTEKVSESQRPYKNDGSHNAGKEKLWIDER